MREELRNTKRTSFIFPVRIGIKDKKNNQYQYFHAFSNDISKTGLKITIKKDFDVNIGISLRFDLLVENQFINKIHTDAVILWKYNKKQGLFEYGISFNELSKSDWVIINDFMKKYCVE